MDIASGILHGLVLLMPKGDHTRPTAIRARQSLFDSLGDLSGKSFADLFAGSGGVGLEAASRGAGRVLFAEGSKGVCGTIRKNCARADSLAGSADFTILNLEFPAGLERLAGAPVCDIVFADPPYAESPELLDSFLADEDFTRWAKNSLLVWEAPGDKGGFRVPPAPWKLVSVRTFGAAKFLFLRTQEA